MIRAVEQLLAIELNDLINGRLHGRLINALLRFEMRVGLIPRKRRRKTSINIRG